jgi:nucleotide-binding universal stress UspA family protein
MTTTSAESGRSVSLHRVVVGVDGSEGATRALEWAAAEADRANAVLEINTAYSPGYEFITPAEVQVTMQNLIVEATNRVAEVAPGVEVIGVTHEGSPAKILVEASRDADLLVVGSRGLGGFKGLLLGSVSQQCSQHAKCPILIVGPHEERQ